MRSNTTFLKYGYPHQNRSGMGVIKYLISSSDGGYLPLPDFLIRSANFSLIKLPLLMAPSHLRASLNGFVENRSFKKGIVSIRIAVG
ncbi:hypothetical protein CEXT_250151 [Caerostris extrusa]|uniref:Uncharacterized protein n=1 Tax=Caerostris extrusa TaxID=172846 RepID=A0AAV4MCK9_CAEEX|nr:hypothetical protein CEXT_250151 [Caerostris extrusa]